MEASPLDWPSVEAAFFDLDKTLLPGSSLFPLAREMYRQRYFTLRDIARLASDRGLDLTRCHAYSDSVNDLPMLELVGNPVAMNPDRKLLVIARKRGWQVLDFRTARRRTLIASAAGGTAAAAGAVGYALGYA